MLCCHNGENIVLPLVVHKATTVKDLKHRTQLRAKFTTHFPNSNAERIHNITLATQSLNGTIVDVGEKFSFNQLVGKRTEQNGYKSAKVIVDGAYVDGVGGGVCQVSTTLYNALLLADILPSACQHSLISNYVLAGFDAMVSDAGADLTFVNNTGSPIYIQGVVQNKSVTFSLFGLPNKFEIQRESIAEITPFDTLEVVDQAKYPHLVYTDQSQVVRGGSNGVRSQSILHYYQNGKLVESKLIRKNNYKKVDKLVARGYLVRPIDVTLHSQMPMGSGLLFN
jgi:vancomycin resistance protein YoaR